ncbi:MAG: nicotinate (nicotinamide) nucleotide adenylyltransferase [Planctomycetes bacterium]|nr:nicotinate (nicotinamide) nucleotide adenylyltransferase [Planctomycetota bacterium]
MGKSILLFGGTFDPVHNAHVRVAEVAAEHLNAQQVIFIPVRRSPHKNFNPLASDQDRLKMIQLAIESFPNFTVSDCEFKRPEPSYTIDTIEYFKRQMGKNVPLYWLVGADTIKDLLYWHRIGEIIDKCNLAIMRRAGFPLPDLSLLEAHLGKKRVEKLNADTINTPSIDLSSTEIRARLAAGEDVSDMISEEVMRFIAKNALYGCRLPKI